VADSLKHWVSKLNEAGRLPAWLGGDPYPARGALLCDSSIKGSLSAEQDALFPRSSDDRFELARKVEDVTCPKCRSIMGVAR